MGTNRDRKEFVEKYRVDPITLSKYPKEIYRFFTHKFEDMLTALDGIIFYSNNEIHSEDELKFQYKIDEKEKINKLCNKTLENYLHFFRFTSFIDESDSTCDYNNAKKGIKVYKQINTENLQNMIKNRINELINNKIIMITKAGIYFDRKDEAYYKKEYAYQTNLQEYNSAWWTEELFTTIKYLKKLEDNNEDDYYDTWMYCKIENLRNKDERQINAQLIQQAHMEFKESLKRNIVEKEI